MSVGSNLNYGTVTIGGTAAIIKAGVTSRRSILIQNRHASNVLYVGDDTSITTANTVGVGPGESIEFLDYNDGVYGIASAAGTDVRYVEVTG